MNMETSVDPLRAAQASATPPPSDPSFDAMSLSADLRRAIADLGFEKPTPVQFAVWDAASAGRDVVVQARTGTGKTAAYGMPLVDKVVKRAEAHPQALILCPTRELALQVARELAQLGAYKNVRTLAIYGGAPMGKQIADIKDGPQIIAGTPGRVLDHLHRGTLDGNRITTLVLDEADEMLSMGFERELSAIIERLPKERTTWLFSATVPPDIERMARTKLKEPEFVILSGDQVGALSLQHYVYLVTEDKYRALTHVIDVDDPTSAIVFCNTKEQTQRLATWLARDGFEADWLMGDLAQADREKVMKKTREGKLRFLVATDVAARGIDISHLTHVINYDFPQDAESYVHRTGRTGRAGRTGTAISLVAPQDMGALYLLRLTYKIRPVERRLPSDRELRTRLESDTVTALAETFAPRGRSAEHLALARRLLSRDDAEQVLAGILHEHLGANPELGEVAQARRRSKVPPAFNEPMVAPVAVPREPARAERIGPVRAEPEDVESMPPTRIATRATPAARAAELEGAAAPRGPAKRALHAQATEMQVTQAQATQAQATQAQSEPDEAGRRRRRRSRAGSGDEVAAPEPHSPQATTEGVRELRIELGASDGVGERELKTILADGGVHGEHVRAVRVRDRLTFVDVDDAVVDAALRLLNAASFADRPIRASASTGRQRRN